MLLKKHLSVLLLRAQVPPVLPELLAAALSLPIDLSRVVKFSNSFNSGIIVFLNFKSCVVLFVCLCEFAFPCFGDGIVNFKYDYKL